MARVIVQYTHTGNICAWRQRCALEAARGTAAAAPIREDAVEHPLPRPALEVDVVVADANNLPAGRPRAGTGMTGKMLLPMMETPISMPGGAYRARTTRRNARADEIRRDASVNALYYKDDAGALRSVLTSCSWNLSLL